MLEPWLYGTTTGVSAVGIVLSVVCWTWLWGPVGLVMAMPLTVCLVAMGKHVPQLACLHTLLSDEAALSRPERLYQRLLAKDEVETDKLVLEYAADHDQLKVFDDLLIPALQLAEKDRHADHLDEVHVQFIAKVYERWLTDLDEDQAPVDSRPSEAERLRIRCLPAKDEADRLVAKMFSQVASPLGFDTDIASGHRLLGESIDSLAKTPCDLVMISALPPAAGKLSRYFCKSIHAHFPTLTILVGLWGGDRLTTTKTKLLQAGASHSVSSMAAAVDFLQRKKLALSLARKLRDVPNP